MYFEYLFPGFRDKNIVTALPLYLSIPRTHIFSRISREQVVSRLSLRPVLLRASHFSWRRKPPMHEKPVQRSTRAALASLFLGQCSDCRFLYHFALSPSIVLTGLTKSYTYSTWMAEFLIFRRVHDRETSKYGWALLLWLLARPTHRLQCLSHHNTGNS